MRKLLIVITLLSAAAVAEPRNDAIAVEKAKMAARAGGMVAKPNSSKGKIAFINTQKDVPAEVIHAAVQSMGDILAKFPVEVCASEPGEAASLKRSFKADIAVIVTADDMAPSLLAAPEDCWAVVNVRALKRNLKSDAAVEKFFDSRCRKEIMRGFVCAAGGLSSSFPGNIMNIAKVEDLDLCDEFVPFDKVGLIKQHLKNNGVMPVRYATYRIACREGWAPAPTNDTQKAIWDKVHEMPSEPIKIKPEEKKTEK